MSLAARLADTRANRGGARCMICRLFVELPEPDNETLRTAVEGTVFTAVQISDALAAEGYRVSRGTVSRHRRGECRGAV